MNHTRNEKKNAVEYQKHDKTKPIARTDTHRSRMDGREIEIEIERVRKKMAYSILIIDDCGVCLVHAIVHELIYNIR